MRKVAVLLVIAALAGCSLNAPEVVTPPALTTPSIDAKTAQEVFAWMARNIVYKPDSPDYWQTPAETWNLRTGDCEDSALLAMYFMHQIGIDSHLVSVNQHATGWWHWVVRDMQTGIIQDPQNGDTYTDKEIGHWTDTGIAQEYTYSDAETLAATRHHY